MLHQVLEYQNQTSLIRKKILEQWLLDIYGEEVSALNQRHIDAIDNLLCSTKSNGTLDLPNRYTFVSKLCSGTNFS